MQPCVTHQKPRNWGRDKRPNSYQRGYSGAAWTKTRMHVIWRDKACYFCGDSVIGDNNQPLKGTTVHHLIPKPEGTDDESNLVACHKRCHDKHHGRVK